MRRRSRSSSGLMSTPCGTGSDTSRRPSVRICSSGSVTPARTWPDGERRRCGPCTQPLIPALSYVGPTVPAMDDLTDFEQQVLAFERGRWVHQGAKDEAVRKTFGLSRTRYEQLLTHLLD